MIILTVLLLSAVKGKLTLKNVGIRAEDVITPDRDVVCAVEGRNVTLSCNYSRAADSLHWYRQYSGSPPQFLILDYSGVITEAQPPVPGISINHVNKLKQVDLVISSAVVSDSALYYCALQPTVTENPATLYKNPLTVERAKADDVSLL
uniref:Ig-like domain-containing protein n=1 Tax=Pygocentrus nattereri TaxID=42514 RepID=A0A3B4EKE6_PYGNA